MFLLAFQNVKTLPRVSCRNIPATKDKECPVLKCCLRVFPFKTPGHYFRPVFIIREILCSFFFHIFLSTDNSVILLQYVVFASFGDILDIETRGYCIAKLTFFLYLRDKAVCFCPKAPTNLQTNIKKTTQVLFSIHLTYRYLDSIYS